MWGGAWPPKLLTLEDWWDNSDGAGPKTRARGTEAPRLPTFEVLCVEDSKCKFLTLHFFRGLCSTHGVSQRFLLVLYEAEVACCSGRFFGASSHGAEPQN